MKKIVLVLSLLVLVLLAACGAEPEVVEVTRVVTETEAVEVEVTKVVEVETEVETVVGKIGRADTPLDPAPISMIETVINYKPKYRKDPETGKMIRQWRDHINTPDDIWKDITKASELLGIPLNPPENDELE